MNDTVWWAFVPQKEGVFVPVRPWAAHSANDFPTEEQLRAVGEKTQRTVRIVDGSPGLADGYLINDTEFYVALPTETIALLLEAT
jgi:hypothetical protein